jgi:chromodomain-helicase-DNA-binding protein 7
VQVVSFLDHLFETEGVKGPFLVCVPLSTIEHWKREFETWSFMASNVYHDTGGGRDMRDIIREFEWYFKGRSRRVLKFHVLITTYDDLIRDYEELAEIPWRVVVVDEAHRLRNTNSKLLECMRSVVNRGITAYGYQHRVLMTGTPLQNNTDELWSLLNFIEPAKFPDFDKFKRTYGVVKNQEQVERLQNRLAPHLLRRVKEDVAKDIPPKEETIIDVELTAMQKQYYRAIFEHNHGFLMQSVGGARHGMPKLMNIQMELRKVCNHPWLVGGVEEMEMERVEQVLTPATRSKLRTLTTGAMGQRKLAARSEAQIEFSNKRMETMVPMSGKMVLIDKLLPKLKREGHKVSLTPSLPLLLPLSLFPSLSFLHLAHCPLPSALCPLLLMSNRDLRLRSTLWRLILLCPEAPRAPFPVLAPLLLSLATMHARTHSPPTPLTLILNNTTGAHLLPDGQDD